METRKAASRRNVYLVAAIVMAIAIALVHQIAGLVGVAKTAPVGGASSAAIVAPDLDASALRAATYSNIYKYDYVGAETCGKCHTQNYASWQGHPHSKMNRNATAATVVANFSGGRLEYGGGSVVFSKGAGEYRMTIYRRDKFVRELKVTRSVGSRFTQMYIGVQSKGPEPASDPVYGEEVKLPFAYWIERDEWFPQTFDDPIPTAEYAPSGELAEAYVFHDKQFGSWKKGCAKCHNTYPYAARLLKAPNNRLAGFAPTDVKLKSDIASSFSDLESWEIVQMGISCESCHFGGREHALEGAQPSFVPKSQDIELAPSIPQKRDHRVINAICNQCHSSEPSGSFANGASTWNSREATDLMLSKCASQAACTNCHNPHRAGPVPGGGPDAPNHIEACVGCHGKYASRSVAIAHGGHGGESKITCLDCHMPRIVHGLSGFIRTHDITSPTDPRMLKGDQPNACNVCHVDRSLAWTLQALETKWNAKGLTSQLGEPANGEPMGKRWLAQKDAPIRGIAVDAYSRLPNARASLPVVLGGLEDPSPPNRMFAVLAVERILGRRIGVTEYTPWAPPNVRHEQAAGLVK